MIVGAHRIAKHAGEPCGDAFTWWQEKRIWSVCLVDGLGHGAEAARASERAIVEAQADRSLPAEEIIGSVDQAIRNSRGAAMSVVQFDTGRRTLRFAGVGNVRMALFRAGEVFRYEGSPGIVGTGIRRPAPETAAWLDGDAVILWTDGLPARLDVESLSLTGSPAEIARHLAMSPDRRPDDVGVVCCFLGDEPC